MLKGGTIFIRTYQAELT